MVGTAPCKLASVTSRMRKWQSARTSRPRLKKSSAMRGCLLTSSKGHRGWRDKQPIDS